jgi:hypothetical protein
MRVLIVIIDCILCMSLGSLSMRWLYGWATYMLAVMEQQLFINIRAAEAVVGISVPLNGRAGEGYVWGTYISYMWGSSGMMIQGSFVGRVTWGSLQDATRLEPVLCVLLISIWHGEILCQQVGRATINNIYDGLKM